MRRFVFMSVIVMAFMSCGIRMTHNKLVDIEKVFDYNRDSACMMLDSIDVSELRTQEDKALYSLMKANSCLIRGNFQDVDSIIAYPVKYYSNKDDSKHAAMAYYYQGAAQMYSNEINKALVSLIKAKQYSELTDYNALKGQICMKLGVCYNRCFHSSEEVNCAKETVKYTKEAGNEEIVSIAYNCLAGAYINHNEWVNADNLLDSLTRTPPHNPEIAGDNAANYASLCVTRKDMEHDSKKAVSLYREAIEKYSYPLTIEHWAKYAYALHLEGAEMESHQILDYLEQEAKDNAGYSNVKYLISESEGDYKTALDYAVKTLSVQDSVFREWQKASTSLSVRDYFENDAEMSRTETNRQRMMTIIVILVSVLLFMIIAIVVITVFNKLNNDRKREHDMYIAMAEEAERMEREDTNPDDIIKKDDEELKQKAAHLRSMLVKLYRLQTMEIGKLAEIVLRDESSADKERTKDLIVKRVKELSDNIIDDDRYKKNIEGVLNKNLDNIMKKICADIPDISPRDRKVLGLFIAGFDSTFISILFNNVSIDLAYKIKSMRKKELVSLDNENKFLYEALL